MTAPAASSRPVRVLLIVNHHSRQGQRDGPAAQAALEAAGLAVDRRGCAKRDDMAGLIRGARDSVDAVVVGGGDGTLNGAAPGLIETGLPLGVMPLGTANDLARTLELPLDLPGAAAVIAAGRTRRIDMGDVNGHLYFNVASLGLGVDLTRALTRDAKQRWGPLGYAIAGMRVLSRLRAFHVDVEADGERWRSRTVHFAVGNGRHYGGGMTVSENAALDDGRLDLYSLEVDKVWRLLMLLPALRSGRTHTWTEIRTLTGARFSIRTSRPRSVNADGEIVTRTPAVFKVLPGAIEVFAPRPAAGGASDVDR